MPKASKAKAGAKPKAISAPVKRFAARLERLRSRLNWIVIYIPFDAAAVWGLRGQIRVKGEINGFAFRSSLFPTKDGRHFLLVNKKMQKSARAYENGTAQFAMALDKEERVATVPRELKPILAEDRSLRRWYDGLSYSARADIAKWISEPKGAETRVRRAEQIAERLMAVMDAERELPPMLQVAFARNPSAHEGWNAMSKARRRGHLFGIFYYRTPDAQRRRRDKMLDDATALAEKINDKATNKKK
jgi:uncharacterized protein YdeI (YjbR/CyaY-like superfamily)